MWKKIKNCHSLFEYIWIFCRRAPTLSCLLRRSPDYNQALYWRLSVIHYFPFFARYMPWIDQTFSWGFYWKLLLVQKQSRILKLLEPGKKIFIGIILHFTVMPLTVIARLGAVLCEVVENEEDETAISCFFQLSKNCLVKLLLSSIMRKPVIFTAENSITFVSQSVSIICRKEQKCACIKQHEK